MKRHPLGAKTKDLGVRPSEVAQSKSRCADLFCLDVHPQSGVGRDVEVVEYYHNFGHSRERSFKPHDVGKAPLSLPVSKRPEGFIVITHSVNAGLDVH